MAIITAPPTRSLYRLGIQYNILSITHQLSVNYIDGVDPNDASSIRTDALSLANALKGVMSTATEMTGWILLSHEGQHLYGEAFSPSIVGTHGAAGNNPGWFSQTLKILGKGVPTSVLAGAGLTSLLVFTHNAYNFTPGEKYVVTPDAPLLALMANLNTNLRYWADYFGQHADTTGRIAAQYNAHEQKRNGT